MNSRKWLVAAVGLATGLVLGACNSQPSSGAAPAAPAVDAAAAAPQERPRVVFLGDSLTAGLGLDPADAYPAQIQARADAAGFGVECVNAGVSGDTSAGGLRRLEWSLEGNVRILVLALGANDGLRGLSASSLHSNLGSIIEQAQARRITVVLAGMEAPPNLGKTYTDAFHAVYADLAKAHHLALVPFLLDGVAGVTGINQPDGIHPTAEGARIVADNVWRVLEPLLRDTKTH